MQKTEYSNISQYMVNTKGPMLAEWVPIRWMEIISLENFTENKQNNCVYFSGEARCRNKWVLE